MTVVKTVVRILPRQKVTTVLSDAQCRNASSDGKLRKLPDSGGLYLWVYPDGRKYWRFRYWQDGKEKGLSLGTYPEVGLKAAREQCEDARQKLRSGLDPSQERKLAKLTAKLARSTTFEAIAREWHEARKHKWTPAHASKVLRRLELDIFPKIGARPIGEIKPLEILSVLRAIEARSAHDLAHRMQQVCGQVFAHAVVNQKVDRNPVQDIRGALKPVVRKHNAHLKESDLPAFLAKLDSYEGLQTQKAMNLLLLTFVRTAELRGMRWEELNLEKKEWRIPPERMKMREPHIVPLARQSVAILEELRPLTGGHELVFPNQHKSVGMMSENTILYALYRMGYHGRSTGHGFRATASTILNENGFRPDVIERQLAHTETNAVRKAYNHAQYLPERQEMMQWWADFLDRMRAADHQSTVQAA